MANANEREDARVREPLTQNRLREVLHYNPSTGIFIWIAKTDPNSRYNVGDRAGYESSSYVGSARRLITVYGEEYYEHRLAWLYVFGEWPSGILDHEDGDATNNRIENLRLASPLQNARNARIWSRHSTGLKGVSRRESGRFRARIRIDGVLISLGEFTTAVEAHEAHARAADKHFGEFACDG